MASARDAVVAALDSAAMARAYALATFGVAFGSFAIEHVSSTITLVTMVAALCVLGAAIMFVRRAEFSLLRLAPTTLVLFVAWAGISLLLPTSMSTSLPSWLALVGFGFLAVVIASIRDTLQTVRALGDTLRALLGASLVVEVLSGLLLDMPFPFLGVKGDLAVGGPIQGLFGTRNLLGLVAVIALITFVVEWRTRSVSRDLAVFSIVLGGVLAVFSASPTVVVLAAAVGAASGALAIVRHTPAVRRRAVQTALGVTVVVGLVAAFLLRRPVIDLLDAGSDFSVRSDLWRTMLGFVAQRPLQGFGWRGPWNPDDATAFPYTAINAAGAHHASALNAYLDVLLQLGALGLLLFVAMCAIALVRAWFVASERRSVLYAWTPLVLVTLLVNSMFESVALYGAPWMLLAMCAVRAGQSKSWRELLSALGAQGPRGGSE